MDWKKIERDVLELRNFEENGNAHAHVLLTIDVLKAYEEQKNKPNPILTNAERDANPDY